jgi:CBS domain-containing protein
MHTKLAKDLMVPLSEYATVNIDANLYDAVMSLERANEAFDQDRHRHRALLVYDNDNKIVGKLSQLDILRALEPKYKDFGEQIHLARFGYSRKLTSSLFDKFSLWETPTSDIFQQAKKNKAKDIMYVPKDGEYVDENAELMKAIHQLVMGHHQSLLVTKENKDDEIVGILRLTDVFKEASQLIKEHA